MERGGSPVGKKSFAIVLILFPKLSCSDELNEELETTILSEQSRKVRLMPTLRQLESN
jgi:hypothetical protein